MTGDAPRTGDTARDLLRDAALMLPSEDNDFEVDAGELAAWLRRYRIFLRTTDTPAQQDDALAAAARNYAYDACYDCGQGNCDKPFHRALLRALEAHPPATDAGEALRAKAALADEVLGDDDHLHVAEESAGVWYEFCEYCPSIQREIDNYKPRPFPHDPDCPKARYDALSARPESAGGQ